MIVVETYNTPGAYYALAYWLSAMLYTSLATPRLKPVPRLAVQGAALVLLITVMTVNPVTDALQFTVSLIGYIAFLYGFIFTCSQLRPLEAAYLTVRTFLLGEFSASLEWQLYYFALHEGGLTPSPWLNILFLLVIHGFIFSSLLVLERRIKGQDFELSVTPKEFLSAAIIGFVVFLLSNISYVYQNTPFSGRVPAEIFNVRTLVDLGGVAILFAYHLQLAEHHMKYKVGKLESLLAQQDAHFQISKKSLELVNLKYHDLKHQIAVFRSQVHDEKAQKALDQLEDEIRTYEAQNDTGNAVLDVILTAKSLYCQEHQVQLTSVVDGTLVEFLGTLDLSSLFGNLLDNAIESSCQVEDPTRRLIHVSVSRQRQFVRIVVENYFEGKVALDAGLPRSTKGDDQFHGFGLRSVDSLVKKYRGSLRVGTEHHWFTVHILLPLPSTT